LPESTRRTRHQLLFLRFVFCERINKRLLLSGKLPGVWDACCRLFTRGKITVTRLTQFFHRFDTHLSRHNHPQYFQTSNATTTQNRVEPRNTASQALRLNAESLCGSSLPDGIANLIQSISLIILIPNNRYN